MGPLIADIYIFDKYGNFWTSKYILRGDDGNNLELDTHFKTQTQGIVVLVAIIVISGSCYFEEV